ncbi:MAG: serine hydrolase domain-containing protein [Candidatus Promineifilaceae bacterium]|nr:serine hydrolase domain-containing protein [Candidatus Promineifilaceae bacterium]
MKQFRVWLIFLPILLFAGFSGTPSTQAATKLQNSPDNSLESLTTDSVGKFVDGFVEEKMAAAHAPGLVITIVYQGEVVLSRGYGVADIETNRPMTAQTNLRAGSVSKPITAAGVLQLVANGEITLDAPVSDYLTELPLEDEYGVAGTVDQLLTLKGGYADKILQTHSPTVEGWQPLADYLQDNLPPRALPPGKVHSYNSWEHALLGQAMAEVTGRPFNLAIADTLLQPLGMAQTTFTQPLPESTAANLATGYAFIDGEYKEVPLDYVNLSPGIALVTTGEDMGRFMLALLNDGELDGKPVLAPSTVAGMLNRQGEVHPRSRGRTYGFSEVTLGDRQVLYQDGNGIGHGNRMVLAPEYDLGIFLSTNHRQLANDFSITPAYMFIKDLSTALLEQYLPAANRDGSPLSPLPNAAARAPRYTGHYRLAGTSQQDFFKLGALLNNVNVSDNGDGTIAIGSKQYVEVEPLLFQSKTDPNFFVVFVEDEGGEVAWLTFGGTGSHQKVQWYETPTVQYIIAAVMLLGFLSFIIIMPFSRYRHWLIWSMSLIGLAFLAGLAYMMMQADLTLFYKTIPPATKLLFLLPWLAGTLALTYPLALISLWRKQPAARVWLLYGLNMAAAAAFIWFVKHWNLFQF